MLTIGIRVVDEEGEGIEGIIVEVVFTGLMGGYAWSTSDENGWAIFTTFCDEIEKVSLKNPFKTDYFTEVSGDSLSLEDEETFSFTLPDDQSS